MGVVYKARQVKPQPHRRGEDDPARASSPASRPCKRFQREAEAAAASAASEHRRHPRSGRARGAALLLDGTRRGPKPRARCCATVRCPRGRPRTTAARCAEAIHYAHTAGILHRDLKPSNILIDRSDQPRITDFGLAKRLDGSGDITLTGQVLGSPNYMPPEQAAGRKRELSDRRSDVYSLGAILYELLTGRPPFLGETLQRNVAAQVVNTEPVAPRLLNPAMPARPGNHLPQMPGERAGQALRHRAGNSPTTSTASFATSRSTPGPSAAPNAPGAGAGANPRWRCLVAAAAAPAARRAHRLADCRLSHQSRTRSARRKAQSAARASELEARQIAYASDMNLAQQAVQEDEFDRALQLLDRHGRSSKSGFRPSSADPTVPSQHSDRLNAGLRTDLRGWEWRYLWRQCQGEERFILGEHTDGATAVGMLADGKTVFSAGRDKFVRLWDLESRRQIGLLPHAEEVIGAAASPDGRWLATASSKDAEGQPVLLWDLATQKIAATLTTNFWLRPGSITFSPDSKWLAFATVLRRRSSMGCECTQRGHESAGDSSIA